MSGGHPFQLKITARTDVPATSQAFWSGSSRVKPPPFSVLPVVRLCVSQQCSLSVCSALLHCCSRYLPLQILLTHNSTTSTKISTTPVSTRGDLFLPKSNKDTSNNRGGEVIDLETCWIVANAEPTIVIPSTARMVPRCYKGRSIEYA